MSNRIGLMRTANQAFPREGNRELFYRFDFSVLTSPYTQDLTEDLQTGKIDSLACMYVDNSLNPDTLTIAFNSIFNVLVQPNYQGVFPVLCSGPTKMLLTTAGAVAVGIALSNTPKPYFNWGPGLAATFSTPTGTFTNRSGFIAAAGTSQQAMAANGARKRYFIENPATATGQNIAAAESLFVNFGAVAGVNNGTSIELLPGGFLDSSSGPVSTQQINVNAATINHAYIALEM